MPGDDEAVYLLVRPDHRRSYIGQTNCLRRRLRQHAGELRGGARATRGQCMAPVLVVRGLSSVTDRLRLEYCWKRSRCGLAPLAERRDRNHDRGSAVVMRRLRALAAALGSSAAAAGRGEHRWVAKQTPDECRALIRRVWIEWRVPDPRPYLAAIQWPADVCHVIAVRRRPKKQ